MKHIKIAAGLAHVNYGRIADLVKEVSDAGADYIHSDAAEIMEKFRTIIKEKAQKKSN